MQKNSPILRLSIATLSRQLANALEFLLIVVVGFGLFIYASTQTLLSQQVTPQTQTYQSADLYFIVCYEIIALALIASFLKWRGWTLKDFNLQFHANMLFIAVLLIMLRFGLNAMVDWLFNLLHLTLNESTIQFSVDMASTILVLVVNSIYEEILLVGYIFKRFDKLHPALVVAISYLLRVSYHTYQDWHSLTTTATLALLFGLYYIRFKKLWPLILAHALSNLVVFLNMRFGWF